MSESTPTFVPGLAPPPGEHSDPNAANAIYPFLLPAMIVCMFLVGVLLIIRLNVRLFLMKQWVAEDWVLLVAVAFYIAYSAVLALGESLGAGKYQWNVEKDRVKTILYLNNINEIQYGFAVGSIKLTLLFMYQRIFAPRRYCRRWWIIVTVMVLNTTFYFGLTWAKVFLCSPRARIWDKSQPGTCGSLFGVLVASGIWNLSSDLVILCMPLFFVWRLKLNTAKRIGLIAVFAIGAIAPGFSILGIIVRISGVDSPDATYNQWRILLIAYAEMTTGIICVCLPVLPRLQKCIKHRMRGGKSQSSYAYASASLRDRRRSARAGSVGHPALLEEAKAGVPGIATYIQLEEVTGQSETTRDRDSDSDGARSPAETRAEIVTAPAYAMTTDVHSRGAVAGAHTPVGAILATTEVTIIRDERRGDAVGAHDGDVSSKSIISAHAL